MARDTKDGAAPPPFRHSRAPLVLELCLLLLSCSPAVTLRILLLTLRVLLLRIVPPAVLRNPARRPRTAAMPLALPSWWARPSSLPRWATARPSTHYARCGRLAAAGMFGVLSLL